MNRRYFPIKTETSCQLKWSWTALYLNTGVSRTCHRTGEVELTDKNFNNFHNNSLVIDDRQRMLQGLWPESGCEYCSNIEKAGGLSDRLRHVNIPDLYPPELDVDPASLVVTPTIVEVFFNNTCNLGCLYCGPQLSSVIQQEHKKFGAFEKSGVKILPGHTRYKDLVPLFWEWFPEGFTKLKRFHVLGGEPFYQKDFFKLLDYIEKNPNPDCEFNIITNLMVPTELLKQTVDKFKNLLSKRALKRIDITCSLDCWGAEQEYVRWGLDLEVWERNFEYLLTQKWLMLNINQTIVPLTIKTMPALINKIKDWRKVHPVGHFFSSGWPIQDYLKLDVLGEETFANDIDKIMACMPTDTEQDLLAVEYMSGILNQIRGTKLNINRTQNLIIYLDEKDRRRKTNWREVFPWLYEIEKNVV
jgi:hypothetical protein